MISFIPLKYYEAYFINFLLIITLVVYLKTQVYELTNKENLRGNNFLGIFLLIIVVFYAGLRPISFAFGDMGIYARLYEDFQENNFIEIRGDFLFYFFIKACSKIMSPEIFFLICMFIYTYPLYLVSKRLFKEYWFYAFFMLIVSVSFWSYGTNGIRNGLATSIFLLAITQKNKKILLLLLIATVNIHQSLVIVVVIYLITTYFKNTKFIFIFWLLSIPLSLILGGVLETFFLSAGFDGGDKLEGYLSVNEEYQESFSKTGFRWDFLIYSSTGVLAGLYFIFKKQLEDTFYTHLFNLFLLTNAVWIIVIRANFSNRFAYLSWFMLGIVIIYPLLKYKFFQNQNKIIGNIILFYFSITYLLNFILT